MYEAEQANQSVTPQQLPETGTIDNSVATSTDVQGTFVDGQAQSAMEQKTGFQPDNGDQAEVVPVDVANHPNLLKMAVAYQLIINNPDFYTSDTRVSKFLDACKMPDGTLKLWRSSMTNARKQLNDEAIEEARSNNTAITMPSEERITKLACDKFRDSWRKVGKGKPLPSLPIQC